MDDELGRQGVVIGGQVIAGEEGGVHPHAGTAGQVEERGAPRRGRKVPAGVLGVDAALHGVAGGPELLLGHAQRQPRGDAQLLPHQVHARDGLGHRVLHLDAGIHLDKIKMTRPVQDELHRPGAAVAGGLGGGHGGRAHASAQGLVQRTGGGLLDEFLIFSLDGTVPLPQMHHISVGVGQDLELDVPGRLDQLFHIQRAVAEAGLGLAPGGGKERVHLLRGIHPPHPAAAPSGRGLYQHGITHCGGGRGGLRGVGHRPVRTGDDRHAALPHQRPRGGLAAHLTDHIPGRADKAQVALGAEVGKLRVLRQKAVARVDRVAAGLQGCGEEGGQVQVALRSAGRAHAHRLSGQLYVQRPGVGGGMDGHRLDVQLPAGPDDPHRDFAPVGDEYPPEHLKAPGRGTGGRRTPPAPRPSAGLPQ